MLQSFKINLNLIGITASMRGFISRPDFLLDNLLISKPIDIVNLIGRKLHCPNSPLSSLCWHRIGIYLQTSSSLLVQTPASARHNLRSPTMLCNYMHSITFSPSLWRRNGELLTDERRKIVSTDRLV